MSEITVLIVDDHSVVRQGVRAVLEMQDDIAVVGEAADGETAIELCARLRPQVVLLNLLMPGINGVETTARIKEINSPSNVIVLTSYHEDEYILPAVKAGALAYLLKDISPRDLIAAVRQAADGIAFLHPSIAGKMIKNLQNEQKSPDNPVEALSRSETEVIKLIAEGLSNADIADRLFVSEKTVKFHVSNILSKLHLTNRTQAAIYAWRNRLL